MTDNTPSTRIAARRDYAGPVFLAHGFRPFFLGAGIWAALALALWLGEWLGYWPPPGFLDSAWHAHEMIFGFAAAALSGFLLTAIPNWTGRLPVRGAPLAALALLWLSGRLAMLGEGLLGASLAGVIDSVFLVALSLAIWREIIAGKNWRNLKTAAIISALAAANIAFHWSRMRPGADTALAERAGIAVLVILISLIGGRIIPSFTRNVLARRGNAKLPAPVSAFDRTTLVATALAGASWVFFPQSLASGVLTLLACMLNLVRLGRWRTLAIVDEPMLWVLHLGYLWIGAGFGLLATSILVGITPQSAAIHAFAAGGFGTMIAGVMSRASRGHNGLPLKAGGLGASLYLAISLAALLRVLGAISNAAWFFQLSGALWIAAFAGFVLSYWKILTTDMRTPR